VPPKAALTEILPATMGHLSGKGAFRVLRLHFSFPAQQARRPVFLCGIKLATHDIPCSIGLQGTAIMGGKGLLLVEALYAPSRAFKSR
jgi:hypothetical protein